MKSSSDRSEDRNLRLRRDFDLSLERQCAFWLNPFGRLQSIERLYLLDQRLGMFVKLYEKNIHVLERLRERPVEDLFLKFNQIDVYQIVDSL